MKTIRKSALVKIINQISKYLLALFLIYLAVVMLFDNVYFLNRYQHYVIVTDSMEPTLNVGDVVFIDRAIDFDEIKVNDILAFETEVSNNEITVIHYVDSIDLESETLRTRPEGTDEIDDWTVTPEDVNGVYLAHIPRLGRFLLFAQSTIGRIVIIVDVIIIYLVFRFFLKKK
jgi:signal peptidase